MGYEKRYNPALQFTEREEFVAHMNAEQPSRPANITNMNFKEIGQRVDELDLAADDHIALICASGQRSSTAGSILLMHNFRHLYNVTGGLYGRLAGSQTAYRLSVSRSIIED